VAPNHAIDWLPPLQLSNGDPDTVKSFTNKPKTTSNRFEPGSKAMIEIIAMGATLDLLNTIGVDAIYAEATRLADRLRNGISAAGGELYCSTGPIVNFKFSEDARLKELEVRLKSANVAFAKRGPGIRLSPHAYTRDEDIELVLNSMKAI